MVEVSLYWLVLPPLIFLAVLYIIASLLIERAPPFSLPGRHAFITGATSGVGLATAIRLVQQRVSVTVVARDKDRLAKTEKTLTALAAAHPGVKVLTLACDVCDAQQTAAAVAQSQQALGPVSVFIHCAGAAAPGYFEELPASTHTAQYSLHYLGAVHCLQALVPGMKRSGSGRVVLVCSMAGLSGVFGYTAYSASKFALRGMAEALHMELSPHGVFVSVVCPPDVDSPGFAREEKVKPEETRRISQGSGLWQPDSIAQDIIDVLQRWRFLSALGFDGQCLALLTTGTSPASSAATVLLEFCSLGVIRLISVAYRRWYIALVEQVKKQREKGQVRPIGKQS